MVWLLTRMILRNQNASSTSLLGKLCRLSWHRGIQQTLVTPNASPPSSSSSSSSSSSFFSFYFLSTVRPFRCDRFGVSSSENHRVDIFQWLACFCSAALVFGANSNAVSADNGSAPSNSVPGNGDVEGYLTNLKKVEDGSVVSNVHTAKWRIYTDNGRSLFLKGDLDEAKKYFNLALQEAKSGFGERDAHVASSLNNLAELYRVRRELGKAEPLYLNAIELLEESFGPEDVRVGVAFHNLGQFYIVQRKLEEARSCYERAAEIKRRVLGHGHPDYADTLYHLGTVLHLLGKSEDAKALIEDSIRILEDGGLGESATCIRRMRYLAQILSNLNELNEVEILQRKVLHIFELSKGWDSVDTVNAAENLALTLQSLGNLDECQELLERCLDASKRIIGEDNIRVAANMLYLTRNSILRSTWLKETNAAAAAAELDNANILLDSCLKITRMSLNHGKDNSPAVKIHDQQRFSLIVLLRSLDAVGLLEVAKHELPQKDYHTAVDSSIALRECISISKEPSMRNLLDLPDVKSEYLSCLKNLLSIVEGRKKGSEVHTKDLQDLKDEVRHIQAELTSRKH